MKVPLKWLRDYVDVRVPVADLAARLTLSGNEANPVSLAAGKWQNVFIGQIITVNPHPNADRLRLATVDLGKEQETVVCGAPNLNVGDRIAFARVGAELFDSHTGKTAKLAQAKIRGVVSAGMCCSEKELGVSEDQQGIMVLPPGAPLGVPLADYLGDTIFDIEVTPNRPDCLSVIGMAREVSALTSAELRLPDLAYQETGSPIEPQVAVEIADPALCPRYCASLITGVKISPSPSWMQERLIACGMRPINNVVDITNYVMLEYGQPLHSFDYERIRGQKIIVRLARPGENLMTLDGNVRQLEGDMLVIADQERAVALAGVMGGANTEVTDSTTSILLESASFKATSIHYTARKLALSSEASMRFERGIRPGLTIPALQRATQLMIQLAGGQAAQGIVDAYPGRQEAQPVAIAVSEFPRILGMAFTVEQITGTLTALGFECSVPAPERVSATPPYWRGDVRRPVDVIEEVARITGYDKLPTTMLSGTVPPHRPDPVIPAKQRLCQAMTALGFQEIISYSLVSLDCLSRLSPSGALTGVDPIRMANPMTADQEYLRTSLLPNLLITLAANRKHDDGPIRLFELGKIHLRRPNDLPAEPEIMCCVVNGPRLKKSWLSGEEQAEFFDIKGIAESLLEQAGVSAAFEPSGHESLHPTKQQGIAIDGKTLGVLGELHPEVRDAFEIGGPVFILEMNVSGLAPYLLDCRLYQPIPRFPAVVRDLALVVDFAVSHQQIGEIIKGFPLVSRVDVFDVYTGKQVPPGKKSLAYRIVYQSLFQTLTEEEVNRVQESILKKLAGKLGAALRA